jgi:hypothetical protein
MADSIAARVVDNDASGPLPFRAPRSASLSTTISNGSARGMSEIKTGVTTAKKKLGKATGFFGRMRGKHKEAAPSRADDPSNSEGGGDGAFNAANREYEPGLFAEIREGWVRRHMNARVADYTLHESTGVRVLTWNVAAKKPPPIAELEALLSPLMRDCSLLTIGLQVHSMCCSV